MPSIEFIRWFIKQKKPKVSESQNYTDSPLVTKNNEDEPILSLD